jgi:DNA invertase Pin-like site-specific DNA recombinase
MKLIAYTCVSTDAQADKGYGLGVQWQAITSWAKANGHTIAAWYSDKGVSGSNGLSTRPGIKGALDAIKAPAVDGLVVPRLDRLARDVILQETLLRDFIKPYGLLFSAVATEQDVMEDDPADPARKMVRVILGAVADYERDLIALRLHSGRAAKAAKGGYAYGGPPYGWRAQDGELVRNEPEQAVITRMRQMQVAGTSLRQIAEALNADGISPRRGRWHSQTVARALERPQHGAGSARPAAREVKNTR